MSKNKEHKHRKKREKRHYPKRNKKYLKPGSKYHVAETRMLGNAS